MIFGFIGGFKGMGVISKFQIPSAAGPLSCQESFKADILRSSFQKCPILIESSIECDVISDG